MRIVHPKIITGIGSLPYDNVEEAIKHVLKYNIPFLPELTRKGDSMLEYIKNPGKLSCLVDFRKAVSGCDLVKVQSVGPATLVLSHYDRDEAVSRVYQHVSTILEGLDAKEKIVFLDEPALGQVGFDFEELWQAIFSCFNERLRFGIHICGNMDWSKLFDSEIEIISFDASQYDLTRYPGYRGSKRIAWGIKGKENVKDFQQGDLITPPCGLAFYNTEYCEKTLDMLVEARDCYDR